MEHLLLPLEILGGLILLSVLSLVVVVLRRRALVGRIGTFDCSVRTIGRSGRHWALGVARYEVDRLDWYRMFSFSVRPSCSFARGALDVVGRREPVGGEALAVQPGAIVVECRHRGDDLEMAMSRDAYTGFASWLESAPPGQNTNVA
ncbi:uncharacterized protein DUF2550 [Kineococcus xinjiangensis]|uniref:Uncharacterized protein DUF2550 n=1 Tax=Kineococcus xinjiangensis TaxID=512762 RepID=A0A2S6IWJ3_9ACTN|nr:DUF2550 domain-containing protein [Kineococcus xinjiangensis]PPK98655.1 uncharacterized protein DUF2550 [Kineococcus xinjiangensis]